MRLHCCACVKVIERLTERELEVYTWYLNCSYPGYLYLRQLSKKRGSGGWPEKAHSKVKMLAFVLQLLRWIRLDPIVPLHRRVLTRSSNGRMGIDVDHKDGKTLLIECALARKQHNMCVCLGCPSLARSLENAE